MANPQTNKRIKTKKHLARQQREAKQIRTIISIAIVIAVIVVGLIIYGIVSQLIIRPKKVIVEVDDVTITVGQMESRVQYSRVQMLSAAYNYYEMYQIYSMYYADYAESYLSSAQNYVSQLVQPVSLATEVLDDMINDIIIRKEATARGITVSQEEVDEAVKNMFGFFPEGTLTPTVTATILSTPTYSETQLSLVTLTSTPSATLPPTETPEVTATSTKGSTDSDSEVEGYDSETEGASTEGTETSPETPTPEFSPTITLTPTITPTPTLYTTEIFAEDLKEYSDLYKNYNFNIDDLRYIIEAQLLEEKLMKLVTEDLVPFQEEVWARHILVETENEAEIIYDLLQNGGDFHELAAENSTDTSTSESGGDLGWFNDETMVAEFTDAAFSLEVGEISEPVESTYGFHIIQVLGKRENQTPAADFEVDKIEAFNKWLSEVRSANYEVVIVEGWEDYAPDKPEVPSDFLSAVFQLSY